MVQARDRYGSGSQLEFSRRRRSVSAAEKALSLDDSRGGGGSRSDFIGTVRGVCLCGAARSEFVEHGCRVRVGRGR